MLRQFVISLIFASALSFQIPQNSPLKILKLEKVQKYPSVSHTLNYKALISGICATFLLFNPLVAFANEDQFIDGLAGIIEAKEVLKPVKGFFLNRQYDPARSNIRYCINQLQLSKKVDAVVKNAIDFVDDPDLLESIGDASTRVVNTAIQLDSTVYTMIFIPSEDGEVPPSAIKYQKQSTDFFNVLNEDLETLLKAPNDQQLAAAQKIASEDLKTFPKFLFKETVAPKATRF